MVLAGFPGLIFHFRRTGHRDAWADLNDPPTLDRFFFISGEAVLRFKLFRDGGVKDLELLNYTGHKALAETSLNAVRASSPFKQLPKTFPDEYLELTWTFIYSINQ